jgi:chromate transport protein ChrA
MLPGVCVSMCCVIGFRVGGASGKYLAMLSFSPILPS